MLNTLAISCSLEAWHAPALKDDIDAVAELSHMAPEKVISMVKTGHAAVLS